MDMRHSTAESFASPQSHISPAEDDAETQALQELNDFLEKPHSIGLDNVKEALRNVVQLMLELKGYTTGYDLSHLINGEHSSLSASGELRDDVKKKKLREFYDWLLKLDQMMNEAYTFDAIFANVQEKIEVIKDELDDHITKLDREIEHAVEIGASEQVIQKKKKRRKKIKAFKEHIKAHEEILEEADTTKDVIRVETEISQNVIDFKAGHFPPLHPRPNPFDVMNGVMGLTYSANAPVYRRSGKGSDDSDQGSSGKSDEGLPPPRVPDL